MDLSPPPPPNKNVPSQTEWSPLAHLGLGLCFLHFQYYILAIWKSSLQANFFGLRKIFAQTSAEISPSKPKFLATSLVLDHYMIQIMPLSIIAFIADLYYLIKWCHGLGSAWPAEQEGPTQTHSVRAAEGGTFHHITGAHKVHSNTDHTFMNAYNVNERLLCWVSSCYVYRWMRIPAGTWRRMV